MVVTVVLGQGRRDARREDGRSAMPKRNVEMLDRVLGDGVIL